MVNTYGMTTMCNAVHMQKAASLIKTRETVNTHNVIYMQKSICMGNTSSAYCQYLKHVQYAVNCWEQLS